MGTPTLRMVNVTFAYPGRTESAVDGVSLELLPGEGAALLGANGAGKSTLLRLAMALETPTHGTVETCGRGTRGLAPEDLSAQVGFVFQHPELQLLERSVAAEVGYALRQRGLPSDEIGRRTRAALEEAGVVALADEHPYDLSPSQRRLVALAAALAGDPALLLLDEPTAGLDRPSRARVTGIVLARRARGVTVVAVTHDGDFALEALDSALVFERGRVIRSGPVGSILGTHPTVPPPPPAALVARELGLEVASLRLAPVAAALAERCRRLP